MSRNECIIALGEISLKEANPDSPSRKGVVAAIDVSCLACGRNRIGIGIDRGDPVTVIAKAATQAIIELRASCPGNIPQSSQKVN